MKNYSKCLCAILVSSMMLTSCATIVSGGDPVVTIAGLSPDSRVDIRTECAEYRNVVLPQKVKLNRHRLNGQRIEVTAENGAKKYITVEKKFNFVTLGNIFILMGGVIGLAIDCATNSVSVPNHDIYFCSPMDFSFGTNGKEGTNNDANVYKNIDDMFRDR